MRLEEWNHIQSGDDRSEGAGIPAERSGSCAKDLETAEESVSRDGWEHRGQHGEEGPGSVCRRMRRV